MELLKDLKQQRVIDIKIIPKTLYAQTIPLIQTSFPNELPRKELIIPIEAQCYFQYFVKDDLTKRTDLSVSRKNYLITTVTQPI